MAQATLQQKREEGSHQPFSKEAVQHSKTTIAPTLEVLMGSLYVTCSSACAFQYASASVAQFHADTLNCFDRMLHCSH